MNSPMEQLAEEYTKQVLEIFSDEIYKDYKESIGTLATMAFRSGFKSAINLVFKSCNSLM